jgi:transcription elongation factor Elf1
MRNNEDRFGGPIDNQETSIPAIVQEQAQTFSYITPTELVDIPSKGLYYPPEHPLHMKDSIEIRHMTAKDEDTLTSRSLLKKGVAVDKMLNDIIIDKSIKVENLLIGDKNALIIASRISGYGAEYETKVTCPSCGVNNQHSFDLNDHKMANPIPEEELQKLGINITSNKNFTITLPVSKLSIEARFLNGMDERNIIQRSQDNQKNNLPENAMTQQIKYFVVSVNGETDRRKINQFIDNMPAKDSKYLRNVYKNINPNVSMEQQFTCSSCGFEETMEVPFTSDFFWPKR